MIDGKELEVLLSKEFTIQDEPVMWSTFILPSGKFVNIDNEDYGSDYGEHCCVYDYLQSKGVQTGSYVLKDSEELMYQYCIKMNINYPYIALPKNKPTQAQYNALSRWIDLAIARNEFGDDGCWDSDDMKGDDILVIAPEWEKLFNYKINDGSHIVKQIKLRTVRGLYEDFKSDLKAQCKQVENKFIKCLSDYFQTNVINGLVCSYIIFRDGTTIGAQTHRDMYDYLEKCGIVPDAVVESGFQVEIFADFLGCIRCTNLRDENYIELPTERLTAAQYSVLEKFLEHNIYTLLNPEIIVTQGTGNAMSFDYDYPYNPDYKHAKYIIKELVKDGEEPVDYIINKIKRMYISGILLEDTEEIELVQTDFQQSNLDLICRNLDDTLTSGNYIFYIHDDFEIYTEDGEVPISRGIWFIIRVNEDGTLNVWESGTPEIALSIDKIGKEPIEYFINPSEPEGTFDTIDDFVLFWKRFFGWGFEEYFQECFY